MKLICLFFLLHCLKCTRLNFTSSFSLSFFLVCFFCIHSCLKREKSLEFRCEKGTRRFGNTWLPLCLLIQHWPPTQTFFGQDSVTIQRTAGQLDCFCSKVYTENVYPFSDQKDPETIYGLYKGVPPSRAHFLAGVRFYILL